MNELSDKNRPKQLEDIFREGMKEAEMAPSDLLWNRIERDLNIKETGYYRERLAWYQRLAAACVVLVLFAGAYLFFDARQDQQAPVASLPQPASPAVALSAPKPGADQHQPEAILRNAPQAPVASRQAAAEEPVQPSPRALEAQRNSPSQARQLPAASGSEADLATVTGPGNSAIPETPIAFAADPPGREFATDVAGQHPLPAVAALQAAGSGPDSLTPALNWPVLHHLTAVPDSIRPASSLLVMAAVHGEPVKEEIEEKKGSRWRFGGKYASQYFDQNIALTYKQAAPAYSSLLPNASLPFANAGASSYADALKEFDQETGSGFSFNTGVSAAYQLGKNIDLETGLGYTQNVATTNTSYIFHNAQLDTRYTGNYAQWAAQSKTAAPVANGIPSTAFLATLAGGATLNQTAVSKTQAFDTQYRYRMLGIPVKVNYQIKRRKSFYYASMGMLTNLLVQANILSDSDRVPDLQYKPKGEGSPFRNWHFAAVAGAGKGFEIGRGLQVKAGLETTQYLTHLTFHPDYLGGKQRKPYTIGLALSSSYTFGK